MMAIHLMTISGSQILMSRHFCAAMNIFTLSHQKPKKQLAHTISRAFAGSSSFPYGQSDLTEGPNAIVGKIASAIDHEGGDCRPMEEIGALLPPGLQRELMPQHVAFVPDGHRRWAKRRGLQPQDGYAFGLAAADCVMNLCYQWGTKTATCYFLSSENFTEEVDDVSRQIKIWVKDNFDKYVSLGVRASAIGDLSSIPKSLQEVLRQFEEATKENLKHHMYLLVNYGGRNDIIKACKAIATKAKDGLIDPKAINFSIFEQELGTKASITSYPDLVIRIGGQCRVSNLLLWEIAYSELYFVDKLGPDFDEDDFIKALHAFQQRERIKLLHA